MTAVLERPPARSLPRGCAIDYTIDVALLAAFVVDMNVGFTGLTIHEWLGLAFGGALVIHLFRHFDWVERITRRIWSSAPWRERIRWAVDVALFASVVLVIATGVYISEEALPALGSRDHSWSWLHREAAGWIVYLTGIHLALSWRWIVRVTKSIARSVS